MQLEVEEVDETIETFAACVARLNWRHVRDDEPILLVTHREGMYGTSR